MNKKQKGVIYWLIFIIVVVAVGSFFYFQVGDEGDGLWGDFDDQEVVSVELPDGVELIERDGDTYVSNIIDGYELKLMYPKSKIDYLNSSLQIVEPTVYVSGSEGGGYNPLYTISKVSYNGSVKDWVINWINDQEYGEDYNYEYKNLNNRDVYIINYPSFGDSMKSLIFKIDQNIYTVDTTLINPETVFGYIKFM